MRSEMKRELVGKNGKKNERAGEWEKRDRQTD